MANSEYGVVGRVIYLYQRMNKFKFQPPQEHRRSLQQPKNQHVAVLAALDKCTQVLREDRLFLRNEIKNCNQEVLEIFKLFPRQSQQQHLQTRLRKYVQQVKNRLKSQQLARFKETLSSQIAMPTMPEPKRTIPNNKPSQSTLKAPLKPSSASTELMRTTNYRGARSQEHNNSSHLNMNSSLRHFQDLLKQKLSQEVIEQRESQNVTSARQGRENEVPRHQQEYNRPKPLQEQFFDSVQNKFAGRNPAYNNFIPSKNLGDSLNFLNDFNKDKSRSTQELPTMKPGPWQFQKKAKQALYQYQNLANQEQGLEEPICQRSRQRQSQHSEDQDSIFDKHFFASEKQATPLAEQQQNEYHSSISRLEVNNPISLQNGTFPNLSHSNLYKETKWNQPSIVNFKLKESNFKETQAEVVVPPTLPAKTSIPRIDNARNSEENLFTPMELLNECRNFLKHRGDSNQKSNANSNVSEMMLHPTLDLASKQDSIVKQQSSVKKEEDSGYVFPEIKESSKKSEVANSTQKEDNYSYMHFETFANSMDQKPSLSPVNLPTYPAKHTFQGLVEEKIPQVFSIEDFLDVLTEATEMNPFITVKALGNVLNSYKNGEALRAIFSSQLSQGKDEELCLPQLAYVINLKYNKEYDDYPHNDKTINEVYNLLDIDAKGFVSRDDISAFLGQIQQAEVDNLEEVSQQLWKLFEGADFSNQHRLTYWHFYLVKNSDQFERVSQLLGEFEFEIDRE